MWISHLVLPLVPKLSPDAPTTYGMLAVSKSFSFSCCYVFQDIMLFMAPVSQSVLIFNSTLLFANISNTVPVVGPSSSMLYMSSFSATTVKYLSVLYFLESQACWWLLLLCIRSHQCSQLLLVNQRLYLCSH